MPGPRPGIVALGLCRTRTHRWGAVSGSAASAPGAGQAGYEHLHDEGVGPRLAAAEVEVGGGQEIHGPHDPVVAELAGLAERLASREGRAPQAEQPGGVLPPR